MGRGLQLEPPLSVGRLVRRYKRFLADVETPHGLLTMHCPNTGAMLGCSEPGSEVWFSRSDNPQRKYPHTLEVVCAAAGRVGVNTARANALVEEAIVAERIPELAGYEVLKREARIPDARGRFDFRLSAGDAHCYVEVKNTTLGFGRGLGGFPDAVSERALRHVLALREQVAAGQRAVLVFCVQHTGIRQVTTADHVHPEYGEALRAAVGAGVEVLAYGCEVQPDCIAVTRSLPFDFDATLP